ncbi:cysteine desulfurase family protein [Dyadobacter psychrotolerans]|uniref:cysteine desulfurase n=1 Tax=Dyadobacter psychrotolerans TaxID=2541721 RepID=A0A4R5DM21_9BACT|nr:cysteine desulfurase family protein [Dyadobacter psychrotolerans]TDE15316.1 cysteine desulfurase [Dyadobacter psychrotolerans]
MEIYCDNAATTAIDSEVIQAILPYLTTNYGNPSSGHWAGRKVKEAIASARQIVANLLGAEPEEIFFMSGATEANNLALSGAIQANDITHVITSKIEHKAVLQTLARYEKAGDIEISFVRLDDFGNVDLKHLENLLNANPQTLISLMHGNNEIGNITDIYAIADLAKRYNAIFHTDTTQTIGKLAFNLKEANIDFLVGSAHKFHGPKGVGFIYINKNNKIKPIITGGGQEKGQRGGTENVVGIVGLAKALELSYRSKAIVQNHVTGLKKHFISRLDDLTIGGITFNGESRSLTKSLSNIASVAFPCLSSGSLVNRLDALGIAVSGGSACSNLADGGSHVIAAIYKNPDKEIVRFSFSKFNTIEEIDHIVKAIIRIYQSDRIEEQSESLSKTLNLAS